MTIDDQIKDEKLQYGVNREAAKISALSSGKIDKYECLAGEEILPSNKKQVIEQATFTYFFFLEKHLKNKQKKQYLNILDKTNELKQIENIFPQKVLNVLIRDKP